MFVVAADTAGVALMLPKTWTDPWPEAQSTYALSGASGVLSAAAAGALDASLLLYPGYFAVVNGGTAAVIAHRRKPISKLAVSMQQTGTRLSGDIHAP